MRFKAIFPLVFVLWTTVSQSAFSAEGESLAPLSQEGISAFQKGDFKGAQKSFEEMLKSSNQNGSHSSALLNNLAFTALKQGQTGRALALWRKALSEEPDYRPALRGTAFSRGRLERKEIPHEVELFDSLHDSLFSSGSIDRFLFMTALTMFATGWLFLRYFGKRRQAILDDKPMPGFPAVATVCLAFFILSSSLTAGKFIDDGIERGTIVETKVEARSSPELTATPLFDLYEGLEVIIRRTSGEWRQVTYPGGATGWIPKNSVFSTADKVVP